MKILASARSGNMAVIIGLLAAAICTAAAPTPLPLIMNEASNLSPDFHQASCPQLPQIVRSLVDQAHRQDVQITAGLLRIFFHDCLPQGCDASIFLEGERRFGPNGSLQPRAENVIEQIRDQVHRVCGPIVSCADILALATREAVNLAGGPSYTISLGRRDSLRPASEEEIRILPGPDTDVDTLLSIFGSRGLSDPADLVSLSGGHTVGRASCGFIRNSNEPFIVRLRQQCAASPARKTTLDVTTPDAFDNKYFVNLRNRQGVFNSDQGLFSHPMTRSLVNTFADNQQAFFNQFGSSMTKMSNLRSSAAGEIRSTCFSTNGRVSLHDASSRAEDDEGIAASA